MRAKKALDTALGVVFLALMMLAMFYLVSTYTRLDKPYNLTGSVAHRMIS